MISASRTGRQLQRYIDGCRQVVGCIPYRFRKLGKSNTNSNSIEDIEVLLVSSQKGKAWLFPKGGWENDESIEIAARRETLEEAGVVGDVKSELGRWRYKSKSQEKYHEGYMFSLLVKEQLDVWPEKNARRRVWMTVNEAREKCPHSWMIEALDVFESQIGYLGRQQQDEQNSNDPAPAPAPAPATVSSEIEDGKSCGLEFLKMKKKKKGGEGEMMMICCNLPVVIRRRHST
ncbi:nudix hydrolase 18, mitochondrial-like [Impatiens glandulifera]|uniref:nudix hydrolase 18, mitochondrial-like n=1 Tax=Impatiens glandulifera TaxID=253017 RepID=UPI001FB1854C|nr:nudix hydrolase 18, mitochondrial-like [Impatiens glandulifera]